MRGWRRHLLLAGIVALYGGTFLAGMALPFAAAFPAGLALLLAYTALMRPVGQWAARPAMLVLTLIVLCALAALIAAAGSGLAVLTGAPPGWLGPALAVLGIAVSRSVWSAGKASAFDAFLDDAIGQIEGAAAGLRADLDAAPFRPTLEDLPEEDAAAIRTAVAALAALPSDPPDAPPETGWAYRMDAILDPLEEPGRSVVALEVLCGLDPGHLPNLEAAALFALRPYVLVGHIGSAAAAAPVEAALGSGAWRVAYAVAFAADRTLDSVPEGWREMPLPATVRALAAGVGGPDYVAPALVALADRLEAAEAGEAANEAAG